MVGENLRSYDGQVLVNKSLHTHTGDTRVATSYGQSFARLGCMGASLSSECLFRGDVSDMLKETCKWYTDSLRIRGLASSAGSFQKSPQPELDPEHADWHWEDSGCAARIN